MSLREDPMHFREVWNGNKIHHLDLAKLCCSCCAPAVGPKGSLNRCVSTVLIRPYIHLHQWRRCRKLVAKLKTIFSQMAVDSPKRLPSPDEAPKDLIPTLARLWYCLWAINNEFANQFYAGMLSARPFREFKDSDSGHDDMDWHTV